MVINASAYKPHTRANRNKLHNDLDYLIRRMQGDYDTLDLLHTHKFIRMIEKSEQQNIGMFHGDNKWYDYHKLVRYWSEADKTLKEDCIEEYPQWFI